MWSSYGSVRQVGQDMHNNLPNERGARLLGLPFLGPGWCKYLCIILMFVLSVFISVTGVHGCSVLDTEVLSSDLSSLGISLGEALELCARKPALVMGDE